MRFREERLRDKDKYVLWVDTYALFPYEYEYVELCISLWDNNAKEMQSRSKDCLTITNPLPNKQWLSCVERESKNQIVGVPFYFDSVDALRKIGTVGFAWVFHYHNEQGEDNRHMIYAVEAVNFDYLAENMDYVIEKRCTAIPSILEQYNNRTRREIINGYEEVIHSCAAVHEPTNWLKNLAKRDLMKSVSIFANRIKSEGNISDEEAYAISKAAFEYLLNKDMLGRTCDNVFMCIFLNRTRRLLSPITDEMRAYLLGSS